MAITYNAGTNVLTVTGAGNTFAAIYAADVAGGWGVVNNQGTNQYYLVCHLVIGDGSTSTDLTDTNVHVQIGDAARARYIQVTSKATFQLGTLSNGTYTTDYGGYANAFTIYPYGGYVDSAGTWKLYGCAVCVATSSIYTRITGAVDFRGCVFSGAGCLFLYGASGTIYRCTSMSINYGLLAYTGSITMDDIVLESPTYGMPLGLTANLEGSGIKINTSTTRALNIGNGAGISPSMRLTDCEYDRDEVYTYSADYTHLLDLQSLDILVLDEQGSAIEDAQIDMTDNVNALFANYTTNLVGYWPLWGSGDDESVNDYDFTTISGATASTDRWGKQGRAYYFDGGDYMQTTATGVLPTGDFTIGLWFKKASGTGTLLAMYNTAAPYTGLRIGTPSGGSNIYLWLCDGVAGVDTNLGAWGDDTWHHLVVNQVNATKVLEIWVDGRYIYRGAIARAFAASTNPLRLGREFVADRYLTGYMSELMMWSRVLTFKEIAQLYCYQKPYFETDASGIVSTASMQNFLMYNNGVGNGMGATFNTFTDFNPYSYRIQKSGYVSVSGELTVDAPSQLKAVMRLANVGGQEIPR